MTWSLVAHDPDTGSFAVAITTCSLAVGSSCPYVRSGVGAVSTQSITNRYLGPAVLDGLARGLAPAAAIEGALVGDDGKHMRQVHAVDRHGRSAAWTGLNCVEWCGEVSGPHVSVAGNMLAGAVVLADTYATFVTRNELSFPERLIAALDAGEAAGGDKRGRQSAAMLMSGLEDFPDLDLRVDDHADPVGELRRLFGLWQVQKRPYLGEMPRKARPAGMVDLEAFEERWEDQGLQLRFRR